MGVAFWWETCNASVGFVPPPLDWWRLVDGCVRGCRRRARGPLPHSVTFSVCAGAVSTRAACG